MKKMFFLIFVVVVVTACHEKKINEIEVDYEPLAQQIDRCEFSDINPIIFTDYSISADLIGQNTKVYYKLFRHSGNNFDSLLVVMSNEGFRQSSFTELLSFHRQKKIDFSISIPVLALGEWRMLDGEKYYPGAYGKRLDVYRIIFNRDEVNDNNTHETWVVLGIQK